MRRLSGFVAQIYVSALVMLTLAIAAPAFAKDPLIVIPDDATLFAQTLPVKLDGPLPPQCQSFLYDKPSKTFCTHYSLPGRPLGFVADRLKALDEGKLPPDENACTFGDRYSNRQDFYSAAIAAAKNDPTNYSRKVTNLQKLFEYLGDISCPRHLLHLTNTMLSRWPNDPGALLHRASALVQLRRYDLAERDLSAIDTMANQIETIGTNGHYPRDYFEDGAMSLRLQILNETRKDADFLAAYSHYESKFGRFFEQHAYAKPVWHHFFVSRANVKIYAITRFAEGNRPWESAQSTCDFDPSGYQRLAAIGYTPSDIHESLIKYAVRCKKDALFASEVRSWQSLVDKAVATDPSDQWAKRSQARIYLAQANRLKDSDPQRALMPFRRAADLILKGDFTEEKEMARPLAEALAAKGLLGTTAQASANEQIRRRDNPTDTEKGIDAVKEMDVQVRSADRLLTECGPSEADRDFFTRLPRISSCQNQAVWLINGLKKNKEVLQGIIDRRQVSSTDIEAVTPFIGKMDQAIGDLSILNRWLVAVEQWHRGKYYGGSGPFPRY